jgi:hypothetical protein
VSCTPHLLDAGIPNNLGAAHPILDVSGRIVWNTSRRAAGYLGVEIAQLGPNGAVLWRDSIAVNDPPATQSYPGIGAVLSASGTTHRGRRIVWTDSQSGGSIHSYLLAH